MVEVEEVLYRWLKGMSKRKIAASLGISRHTVKKLILQAEQAGLKQESSVNELEALRPTLVSLRARNGSGSGGGDGGSSSSGGGIAQAYLASQHLQIEHWRQLPHMTVTQMVRLFQDKGDRVSETSLRRYIKKHFPSLPASTVHLETVPGQQAQVDFGYVGLMVDPLVQKLRKAYAFIMTLSHSRYRFVRFVFRQDVATWVDCHIRAFHFFGGVPQTVMLDNLKAGVLKADIYDPVFSLTDSALERQNYFVCYPDKVRVDRHKDKVERSVQPVRQQVLAGKNYQDIEEANTAALHWCRHEIAGRVTRTTGHTPWELFDTQEKPCLKPLPSTDYECALWQELRVHRDHHVVFDGSYYSLPTQYIGQTVWLRATARMVELYINHQKVKAHVRSQSRGQWITDQQDYTKGQQIFLSQDKEQCLQQAKQIGPFTTQFLEKVLTGPTMIGQRKAQAILRLADTYDRSRVESACQRSVGFGNYTYRSLKKILAHNYAEPHDQPGPAPLRKETSYIRSSHEFAPLHGGL